MEKELKDILLYRSYEMLSPDERDSYSEWFSGEEEFERLKMAVLGAEMFRQREQVQPKPGTKQRLDALFEEKHAHKKVPYWYNGAFAVLYPDNKPFYRKPLIQVAALFALILLTIPLLTNIGQEDRRVAKAEPLEERAPQKLLQQEDQPEVTQTQQQLPTGKDRVSEQKMVRSVQAETRVAETKDLRFTEEPVAVQKDEAQLNKFGTASAAGPVRAFAAPQAQADELKEFGGTSQEIQPLSQTSAAAYSKDIGVLSDLDPQGVRKKIKMEKTTASVPVSSQSGVLDLLTATF